MKPIVAIVLLSAAALACGCASNSKPATASASAKPVNKVCAIMTEHPVKEKNTPTVAWKGQTVGFCCGDCIDEWNKLSAADKDKALASALAAK